MKKIIYLSAIILLITGNLAQAQQSTFKSKDPVVRQLDLPIVKPILPPVSYGYVIDVGIDGANLHIFEDKSVDCKTTSVKCIFHYQPLFYFEKDANDMIRIDLKSKTHSDVDLMVMYIIMKNQEVEQAALRELNRLYQKQFTTANLQPIHVQAIDVTYPYALLDNIPNFILESTLMPTSNEIYISTDNFNRHAITFQIPKGSFPELAEKLRDGLGMYVRYAYADQDYAENNKQMTANITMDANREREFFGNRDTVMATMDQILEFFYDSRVDITDYNYVEDERFAEIFVKYGETFLQSVFASEQALGEITLGQLSQYKLNLNEPLVSPNFTTSKATQSARSDVTHKIMTGIHKTYNVGDWQGGGKVLGLFGGSAQRHKESENFDSKNNETKKIKELAKADQWTGMKIDPLQIKVYEVSKMSLKKSINASVSFVMVKKQGITSVGFIRDTSRHLTAYHQ